MMDGSYRKHVRRPGFDYRQNNAYFVTVVSADRECVFGIIDGSRMMLSRRGLIAQQCWNDLPAHHPFIELDAFVVMPNHIHGIVCIVGNDVAATPASPIPAAGNGPASRSLSAIVGSYKSAVTRTINRIRPDSAGRLWQPNFYEHIVRDDCGFRSIQNYIVGNPGRWPSDEMNLQGDGRDQLAIFLEATRKMGDAGVAATEEAS